MHAYRTAASKEDLDRVDTFRFDKNYNNFWDPNVLENFVTNIGETWKESYGFRYTSPIRWDGKTFYSGDVTRCHVKCARLVSTNVRSGLQQFTLRNKLSLPGPARRREVSSNVASITGRSMCLR